MPQWKVTLSDGRVVTVESASQPSESDVMTALGSQPEPKPATSTVQTFGEMTMAPAKAIGRGVLNLLKNPADMLPLAGGAAGGALGALAGPPGAVGGAAVGGMAGKALQNIVRDKPASEGTFWTGMEQGAIQLAPGAAGLAGSQLKRLGRSLTKSAFRPLASTVGKQAGAGGKSIMELQDATADVAMRERINASPGGFLKLHRKVDILDDAAKQIEQNSTAQIDPAMVATRLDDTRDAMAWQTNPQRDARAIGSVERRWESNPKVSDPMVDPATGQVWGYQYKPISVSDAQRLKRGEYQRLKNSYGEMKSAEVEGRKGLARGLREEVMQAEPSLSPLLSKEAELLRLSDVLERTLATQGIAQPIRLYEMLGITGRNAPALMLGALTRPGVKSMIGRGANDMGRAFSAGNTHVTADAIRAALLARMGIQNDPE